MQRRTVLLGAAALGATLVASPSTATAALRRLMAATVDMEAVVKAAQIDPRRADSAPTPGSKESVLAVEKALQAKGLLADTYVDGHFGTSTIDAYAQYQESLGQSEWAATGLPDNTSLDKLGSEAGFTVSNPLTPGERLSYRGVTMNARTKDMLVEAEKSLSGELGITQGSYNAGNPGSAGTHDGGGVLDISVSGMDSATMTATALELRKVGFAAWVRTPAQGFEYHIHAVALADTELSPAARNQAGDYYLGMNGLANRGPDDGPKVDPIVIWEEYKRG